MGYGFQTRPWWTPDAVEFVDSILTPESRVLEFGCGGSTVWLAARAAHVISVDNSEKWIEKIRPLCPYVDLRLMTRPYFHVCNGFDDETFDLVIVDGRDRVECFLAAVRLVKPGGWIMLDDASRERYREAWESVADWHLVTTKNADPKEEKTGSRTSWLWRKS